MASFPLLYPSSSLSFLLQPHHHNFNSIFIPENIPHPNPNPYPRRNGSRRPTISLPFRTSYRLSVDHEDEEEDEDEDELIGRDFSFEEAVALFNRRAYYDCHDILEFLWNRAEDPSRTLLHGILQCAVGLHHLFNRNHRGAMMELGEGLCKLRKMEFKNGPFCNFELEISAVLDFVYLTQIELAACDENLCVTMDQTERSYELLGGYGAGQELYSLEMEANGGMCIVFCPQMSNSEPPRSRVKLPTLSASQHHLLALHYH